MAITAMDSYDKQRLEEEIAKKGLSSVNKRLSDMFLKYHDPDVRQILETQMRYIEKRNIVT